MAFWKTDTRRGNRRRDGRLKAVVRSAERRRSLRQRLWVAFAVLIGIPAAAAGLYWGGGAAWRSLFVENDFFVIRRIEVTTDGDLGVGHICEYARVRAGLNLFAVRPREVREALLTVPVIESAQVGRRLPDTLVIEVAERVAVARLGRAGAGSPLAVDATGHVLGPSSVRASLPVILGVRDKGLRPGDVVADPMLQDALQVLAICSRTEMRRHDMAVATIDLAHEDRLEVGLATGELALLARERLESKLDRLRVMREKAREKGLELAVYDLTVDRNYVGRPAAWTDPAPTAANNSRPAGGAERTEER